MSSSNAAYLSQLAKRAVAQPPFSLLDKSECSDWISEAKLLRLKPGQTIINSDKLQDRIYLVVEGQVRLLAEYNSEIQTVDLRGPGQIIGWVSILRGQPCEWVIASEQSLVLALSAEVFVNKLKENPIFLDWFGNLPQIQETVWVAKNIFESQAHRPFQWQQSVLDNAKTAHVTSLLSDTPFVPPSIPSSSSIKWYLSTANVPKFDVGFEVTAGHSLPAESGHVFPYRLVGFSIDDAQNQTNSPFHNLTVSELGPAKSVTPTQLGILEEDEYPIQDKYPFIQAKGVLDEALAVCEMAALQQKVPFRRDHLKRILEDQFRRDKTLSLELLAGLTEALGLRTQLGSVDRKYCSSIECPAMLMLHGSPIMLFEINSKNVVIGNPRNGAENIEFQEFLQELPDKVSFALPRRVGSTPTSRFGWHWFTPLLSKYKKSLILVFVSSLLAQLFGLGIPLLIQQIIDKVLAQGNLSSLNVLGTVMILLAVFQGCLTVLRTYIFVDTTDRMDLTLGSAVIDRLLSLPLSFFEKRPVGELSQRIGELNTIRGFLTGTALVSVLNIIFAFLYLIVMIVYSPLLTAVALSTLPLYLLLVFGIAPIYRHLIRKRASAQAKTQSHLIEVLGGIQTVKAQHFELTARWKWQDRYKDFVTEGFKGVVVGSTSGQIGAFLNQLSSLLVLWVGMWLVLQGDLTLGMLIAFRIISSNVTGPLLQLSGLYQGFQKVQVSMERISDILDQNPELSRKDDADQIAMPPIQGNIRFENVKFRFSSKGEFQVDNVSLSIDKGSFVGVVGQSGSGKSTLMKLLPRLYDVESGNIYIDDYDISKVDLSSLRRQIGIVPQDSLLFEGTIAENIALNDPQSSDEAIIEASKIACAHEFIMTLSDGYATKISERGSNLSGGQRQRIAIARTIMSNPQLLVMDEATSALDYNTEKQLCINLQNWAKSKTVLFITHRLSSIKTSDKILVMHDGRLVESGTHGELINNGERYSALYQQQND